MALTFHFRPDLANSADVAALYPSAAGGPVTVSGGYVVVPAGAVPARLFGSAASYTHGITGFEGVNITRATGLQRILVFYASSNINKPQLTVTIETNGDLKAYIGSTGAPLATYTYAAGIADGVPHKYEAELLCHSSAGSFSVRLDGVPVLSASGINTNPQATGNFNGWLMSAFTGSAFHFRDHYLLDAATSPNTTFIFNSVGQGQSPSFPLASDGYINQWSASASPHYSQINGAFDAAKWVLSTSLPQTESYGLGGDPYPFTPQNVAAVQVNVDVVATGGATLTPFVRRAGVNYPLSAFAGMPTISHGLRFVETNVDPSTGNAWSQSELTDGTLEFGFVVTGSSVRVYQFFVQPLIVPVPESTVKVAASHLKVTLGGVSLENDLNSSSLNISQETPEVTSLGDPGPRRVVANYDYDFDLGGVADFASGRSDITIFGLVGSAGVAIGWDPTGQPAGLNDPNYDSASVLLTKYELVVAVGDAVKFSANVAGNAALSRSTS